MEESFVLLAALGPPFQRSSRFAWERFVFTWPYCTTCSPQSPLPAGPSPGDVQCSLSGLPALPKAFEIVIANVFSSLRAACLPGPAVYDADKPQARSKDTTRTRCLPDSDALSLSIHVTATKHWEAVPPTWLLANPWTAAMPCTRHEDSVPLVAVAKEACRSNPLCRCFEFFGATLPFESNRAIAKSLHAALAAAGPHPPRLTLEGRMGTIPAGLNFQHRCPQRIRPLSGTRRMAL